MKKAGKVLASLVLALAMTMGNTVFALDGVVAEPIEPDYKEIVEEIFPGYWDPQISPNWSSGDKDVANPGTHGYITQVACMLLRDDDPDANTFYAGQRTDLIRGSILPDVDETSNRFYLWHFYGPTGTTYDGGSTTAYSKCIEHYNNAVDLYLDGATSDAMETLGRALHYLQDVNEPHHAMNNTAADYPWTHLTFESYVEDNQESYEITSVPSYLYTDANSSLGRIIDDYADMARNWYEETESEDTWDSAASSCVRNSQRATITVLYKFMNDVGYI